VKGVNRRQFTGSAAAAALAGAGLRPQRAAARDAFSGYDGIGQAQLIRSKQATPLELVDCAIARIEAANPKLNAIVWEMFEHARTRAKGKLPASPLSGVPYLIKDLNNVAGERTTWGSRFGADTPVMITDPLPQRAIGAGLVIVGKTNTPEFGLLPTTESLRLGPCHNPWNLDCSSGGSSGGAAAAVAAGLGPAAHASDGGGSIQYPIVLLRRVRPEAVALEDEFGAGKHGAGRRRDGELRQPHGARQRRAVLADGRYERLCAVQVHRLRRRTCKAAAQNCFHHDQL
jgi:amidase